MSKSIVPSSKLDIPVLDPDVPFLAYPKNEHREHKIVTIDGGVLIILGFIWQNHTIASGRDKQIGYWIARHPNEKPTPELPAWLTARNAAQMLYDDWLNNYPVITRPAGT